MIRRFYKSDDEEESFFVSMTDMVVGVLFIFVILLMYFAFQLRDETEEIVNLEKSVDETRTEILKELQQALQEAGIRVTIDPEDGVLRLPEDVLFESGERDLSDEGKRSVEKLGAALLIALECHAFPLREAAAAKCEGDEHEVDTIFVEGHTDGDQIRGDPYGNWTLSVSRATNTYRQLVESAPDLEQLKNQPTNGEPIFSVSGYADRRPVDLDVKDLPMPAGEKRRPDNEIEARLLLQKIDSKKEQIPYAEYLAQRRRALAYIERAKPTNRRIDLRIIMKRELPNGGQTSQVDSIQNAIRGAEMRE